MKKFFLGSLLAAAIIMPSGVMASENFEDLALPAGKVNIEELPKEFQEKLAERKVEINDYFEKLTELRIEADKINQELLNSKSNTQSVATFSELENILSELEYYENNSLSIVGLEKIELDNNLNYLVQPLSTNTQVDISKPTVYYDNDTSSYVAAGGWKWNTINPDNNNRGRDGFGINIAQERISILEDHLTTWDYNGNKYWPSNSVEASSYGYYQTFDDNSNGKTYTAHQGSSWMFFRFYDAIPVNKTVNFNTQYNHTWSGVNITGVTVGPTSISLSFSSDNNRFVKSTYSAINFSNPWLN